MHRIFSPPSEFCSFQKELERLKKANQLSMEAQRLLMTESEGVKYIHKSTAEVRMANSRPFYD